MRRAILVCILLLGSAVGAAADPVVILVRHAERADAGSPAASMMAADPDLSAGGRARADALARILKDAGITAIFTTELKRTRQTAGPLARALAIQPTVIPADHSTDLLKVLQKASGTVLVVGHSNTVPELIAALGVKQQVAIADDEYDNLFVVVRDDQPTLLRLRYSSP